MPKAPRLAAFDASVKVSTIYFSTELSYQRAGWYYVVVMPSGVRPFFALTRCPLHPVPSLTPLGRE